MTTNLIIGEAPLPVVLRPTPDELLSSWLRRHTTFYGVTEPMFASWLGLGTKSFRTLDHRLGLGQIARIVEKFRCDPNAALEMTHALLPPDFAPLAYTGRITQFCGRCWERNQRADARDVVMKSWREGWRLTCPVCGSPLSDGDRPRQSEDTVRHTSPFSKEWDAARKGEDIVNRKLRGEPTSLASPIAMMRLLLTLSWRHAETPLESYRKSWLLNAVIPGFDAEALRLRPSISKGATAFVPLHLRVALLAGLAAVSNDALVTVRRLRLTCRVSYLKRFDELAMAALGESPDFSI
jgi:hypothetical protein